MIYFVVSYLVTSLLWVTVQSEWHMPSYKKMCDSNTGRDPYPCASSDSIRGITPATSVSPEMVESSRLQRLAELRRSCSDPGSANNHHYCKYLIQVPQENLNRPLAMTRNGRMTDLEVSSYLEAQKAIERERIHNRRQKNRRKPKDASTLAVQDDLGYDTFFVRLSKESTGRQNYDSRPKAARGRERNRKPHKKKCPKVCPADYYRFCHEVFPVAGCSQVLKSINKTTNYERSMTDSIKVTGMHPTFFGSGEISLSKAKELDRKLTSDIKNIRTLLIQALEVDMNTSAVDNLGKEMNVASVFGEQPMLRIKGDSDGLEIAQPALCQPEMAIVEIGQEESEQDPNVNYYPKCTRVARCGGCCSHRLLSCQPTNMRQKTLSVMKWRFDSEGKINFDSNAQINLDEHLECKCDCKVHASDCNFLQVYRASECRCVCSNAHEEIQCNRKNSHLAPSEINHFWNPHECRCQCKTIWECSTGLLFDEETCSCSRAAWLADARERNGGPMPDY